MSVGGEGEIGKSWKESVSEIEWLNFVADMTAGLICPHHFFHVSHSVPHVTNYCGFAWITLLIMYIVITVDRNPITICNKLDNLGKL